MIFYIVLVGNDAFDFALFNMIGSSLHYAQLHLLSISSANSFPCGCALVLDTHSRPYLFNIPSHFPFSQLIRNVVNGSAGRPESSCVVSTFPFFEFANRRENSISIDSSIISEYRKSTTGDPCSKYKVSLICCSRSLMDEIDEI